MHATPKTPRLGDVLVAHGAITRAAIEHHIGKARGRLGHYLRAHNLISGRALARGLAAQHDIAFIHFTEHAPDKTLFRPCDLPHYVAYHYVPFARARDGLVVATCEPSPQLRAVLEVYYQTPITLIATGPFDLTHYFASVAATTTTRRARLSLRRKHRNLVADRTLLPHQQRGILLLIGAITFALILAPETTWYALLVACNIFYLASLTMKLQLFKQGHAQLRIQRAHEPALALDVAALNPETLPVYTVLVPLYMETSAVMERLIGHLQALDYPREKLDIKLICEADDTATITALKALAPPQTMQITCVPPSQPRTKPKACNVALQQIRGEFLVIFDAEDAPAPDQLKRAVALFHQMGKQTACVQASLNYYNRDENLLTQLFAIEYSALFSLCLPALERMGMPIPLGGTSNHLRVSALSAVGGWDAFNVTEDADLGIRLAYLGYETHMLPSLTLEEAPISLGAWMRQRTRWIKGYIQTWLVYMRDPRELKRRLGGPRYFGFQFFVGAPVLTFLLAPFFWVICFTSLTGILPHGLSPTMQFLCAVSFVGGIFSNWLFARAVMHLEGWEHMRRALFVYPFYWLLHSFAAARALWQLATNPHYWEKTRHGVSKLRRAA